MLRPLSLYGYIILNGTWLFKIVPASVGIPTRERNADPSAPLRMTNFVRWSFADSRCRASTRLTSRTYSTLLRQALKHPFVRFEDEVFADGHFAGWFTSARHRLLPRDWVSITSTWPRVLASLPVCVLILAGGAINEEHAVVTALGWRVLRDEFRWEIGDAHENDCTYWGNSGCVPAVSVDVQ